MSRITVATGLALLPLLVGCGSARLVRDDPHGGEIRMSGGYMPAISEAKAIMAEHCGGRFVVEDHPPGNPTVPPRGTRARFLCADHPEMKPAVAEQGKAGHGK